MILTRTHNIKGIEELPLSLLILLQCLLFWVESHIPNSHIINSFQIIIDWLFLIDLGIKSKAIGKEYWKSPLNIFDAAIVLISIASHVVLEQSQTLTALRVLRLLRLFRIMRLIPNFEHIAIGIKRALKASRGVFLMLAILITFFSILGYLLFSNTIPSHFADPMLSSYTVFSLFTVEGWNEIPSLVERDTIDYYLVRAYVISVIVFGSFFALSLANAIFIDEMVIDNNNELEEKIDNLTNLINTQNKQIEELNKAVIKISSTK